MTKKNILLIIKSFQDKKEENFFYALRNYLNERRQNRVFFYFLRENYKVLKKRNLFYGNINGALDIVEKEKIDIVAATVSLGKSFFGDIARKSAISVAINMAEEKNCDISLNIDFENGSSLVDAAQKLSIVDKLNWDTNFFNFNIAKLNHQRINERIIKLVLAWSKKNKIKCLYYAADGKDWLSIRLAEKYGFSFVNIRVTYSLVVNNLQRVKKSKYSFRKAGKADLADLMKMSKNLYLDSKYYFDKNFPDKLCDKFYLTWIKKLALSRNKEENVYVLTDSGKLIAYIASGVEYNIVHIFLVAVDSDYQRKGLGKLLISEFIKAQQKFGYKKFKVVTQGRNIAALRLYQSYGFKIVSEQIEYHKWF